MTATLTLNDVRAFISGYADEQDLDAITRAVKARSRALMDDRAANLKVGTKVTLTNLSPKYLCGLTGTVKLLQGSRATVTLDAVSTEALRRSGRSYYVPVDVKEYDLSGVPSGCCIPA